MYMTPREFLEMARAYCRRHHHHHHHSRATSARILFHTKGTTVANTVTVGPGGNVTGTGEGRDDRNALAALATPLVWTFAGIDGATVTPSTDTLSVVIQLPPDVTSGVATLTMQTADPAVSATGTITVAEGAATKAFINFTVNPTP